MAKPSLKLMSLLKHFFCIYVAFSMQDPYFIYVFGLLLCLAFNLAAYYRPTFVPEPSKISVFLSAYQKNPAQSQKVNVALLTISCFKRAAYRIKYLSWIFIFCGFMCLLSGGAYWGASIVEAVVAYTLAYLLYTLTGVLGAWLAWKRCSDMFVKNRPEIY